MKTAKTQILFMYERSEQANEIPENAIIKFAQRPIKNFKKSGLWGL